MNWRRRHGSHAKRRRPAALEHPPEVEIRFEDFEVAQGPGLTGIPVEAYRFQQGATVWRYTSADRDQVFEDGTFTPAVVNRDEINYTQESTSQGATIKLSKDDPVAQLFVSYNPPTPVTVRIWKKHRAVDEEDPVFVGEVTAVAFDGPEATLTCAPLSNAFRRRVPAIPYQSQCVWPLYGTGCGVSSAAFKTSGTVLSISGTVVRATAFGGEADGYFENGWAELSNGDRRFIVRHTGTAIQLQSPFPSLAVGAAIDAYAGCRRTLADCRDKFSNEVNHLGFDKIPTRNPYDGRIA